MLEIPKSQAPNHKQIPDPNFKIQNRPFIKNINGSGIRGIIMGMSIRGG